MLKNIGNSTPVLSSLEITENSKKTLIPLHYKIQQTPTPLAGNLLLINSLTLANCPDLKRNKREWNILHLTTHNTVLTCLTTEKQIVHLAKTIRK
jgi:hypothetical protein